MREAIDLYLRSRRRELAASTMRELRIVLGGFASAVGPDTEIETLTVRHLDRWATSRQIAPVTLSRRLSVIRTWLKWLRQRDYLHRDPSIGYKGPRLPRLLPREIAQDEVRLLLHALPDTRARLAVSLMVIEGLRLSEVARLQMADVDMAARTVLVIGKGGHERWLPLSDDTWAALQAYLLESPRPAGGPLLCSKRDEHQGIGSKHLGYLVSQWMRDAGIKRTARDGRSAHALRHTAAGSWLDDGADPRLVQQALGHSSLSSTWVYLRRRQATGALREFIGKRSYQDPDDREIPA